MAHLNFAFLTTPTPIVRQTEQAECAIACLAMIAAHHGYVSDLPYLRRQFSVSLKGTSLTQLVEYADQLNLGSRPIKCELEELSRLRLPAILHWNMNHFVVLERVGTTYTVLDPALGRRKVRRAEVDQKFTGIAIELSPTSKFVTTTKKTTLRLSQIVPFSSNFWKSLLQGLALSIFLQFFVLLGPLFMQLVIDEAILKADLSLLFAIAGGFALLRVFEFVTSSLRSFVFQFLSAVMSYDMKARVFAHLMRLPLTYFQQRHIGDLQQRFTSLEAIKNFIVEGAVSTIIDGFLAVTIGIALFLYAPVLAMIVVLTILIYGIVRLVFLGLSQRLEMSTLIAEAQENTHFLETLRGIQTIKITGLPVKRELSWRNLVVGNLNTQVQLGNTNIAFRFASELLLGLSNILIVYLAATSAITGALTVGMIMAFLSYKSQFETRLMRLLDVYLNARLLDVHLERISDILATEPLIKQPLAPIQDIEGGVRLEGVCFKYAPSEPNILENISVDIEAGEFVAISGASGIGKSTLLRLILGLHTPTSGQVFIDQHRLGPGASEAIKAFIGVVLQDDRLLTGTIEQNISLFADRPDADRISKVARIAEIEHDILSMPMQYQSLVGDMGTTLSVGQSQRVMLARALYRSPKLLVMDEGTSNLDVATEARINASLKNMSITRIVAAHRPETLMSADRVFKLTKNGLHEIDYRPKALREGIVSLAE